MFVVVLRINSNFSFQVDSTGSSPECRSADEGRARTWWEVYGK